MRVVVDTNVWISAVINALGAPARVLQVLRDHRFLLVSSTPLLDELASVLTRPRFAKKYQISHSDIGDLVTVLRDGSELIEVRGELRICRDAKDDLVIETALGGLADVLVTRDDDIKRDPALISYLAEHGVEVLTVRQFLERLEASPGDSR